MSAKKQKREIPGMPPEYVKGPGKPGKLNPYWRKSFPDDEADADGRGKVVFLVPESLRWHGEWRRVPGHWKILAAADGFIMTEGEWVVRKPTVGYNYYLRVGCNGKKEYVHLLVARAFKGRPAPDQVSVDHIDRDESNNCEANLKWATWVEQMKNTGKRKVYSNGEPCILWQVMGSAAGKQRTAVYMTPVENTMKWFPSKLAAAKALRVREGNLSAIFNGNRRTVCGADGKWYTGEWDSDLTDLEGEEWKEIQVETRNRLFLSNYGRIQRIYPGGREGTKHYPQSSNARGYLIVGIDNKNKFVHVLVGELFYKGSYPPGWAVWDHIDNDKQSNHISNLRPVTVEENNLNTARQHDFVLWPKDDPDDWVRCVSQARAARDYGFDKATLGAVLHKRPDKRGYVRKTVHGYCAAWCDEEE